MFNFQRIPTKSSGNPMNHKEAVEMYIDFFLDYCSDAENIIERGFIINTQSPVFSSKEINKSFLVTGKHKFVLEIAEVKDEA